MTEEGEISSPDVDENEIGKVLIFHFFSYYISVLICFYLKCDILAPKLNYFLLIERNIEMLICGFFNILVV